MYTSKYTNRKVSAAQYIAEICCVRKAAKEGKKLGPQFWKDKAWGSFFKRQMILANSLLKMYSVGAIIQGMNTKQTKWAYSLSVPDVVKAIEIVSKIEKKEEIEKIKVVAEKKEIKKKTLFDMI